MVEDNPDMNAYVAQALGPHYRVVTAFDGQEGLRKALETRPDLIVSDVMMPRMSGDQMVSALRRHQEMDDVPIVLLTAKADDELRVKLLKEGVQDYVYKPFSVEELLARVSGLISERKRKEASLREAWAPAHRHRFDTRCGFRQGLHGAVSHDQRYRRSVAWTAIGRACDRQA